MFETTAGAIIAFMGNTQTCGFGVLNKSHVPELNIGLSMAGTHYYENSVKEGEIFYRWPGAVHYTVYAFVRSPDGKNDITNSTCAKEISGVAITSVVAAGITVATMGTMLTPAAVVLAPLTTVGGAAGLTLEAAGIGAAAGVTAYKSTEEATKAMGLAFKNSKLYCEMKNCYGGGAGSWLVIEGGPYIDRQGRFQSQDLSIKLVEQEYVFRNGSFTRYSHDQFHTKENLQCTENCPHC